MQVVRPVITRYVDGLIVGWDRLGKPFASCLQAACSGASVPRGKMVLTQVRIGHT